MDDLPVKYKIVRNVTKEYPHKTTVIKYTHPYAMPLNIKLSKVQGVKLATKILTADIKQSITLRRAKTTLKDIAECNSWDYFATFTFDQLKIDRSNPFACKAAMQRFLHRIRNKYGTTFNYLIIPEFHADGTSLHFHALISGYPGKLTPGINKKTSEPILTPSGDVVYNVNDYRLGFSTFVPVKQSQEDFSKVSSYMSKYITKNMPTFAGKKHFWVSRGLQRPIRKINNDLFDNLSKTPKGYIVRR